MPPAVAPFKVESSEATGMIIPVSKQTYFNTKWVSKRAPLSPYDMLYHPPDYNPKAARSDRQEPKIIRRNIWDQEFHKGIPSTTHFILGRPKWKILDVPNKDHIRVEAGAVGTHAVVKMILSAQNCQCPLEDSPSSLADAPLYGGAILFMVLLEKYIKGRCAINDPCNRVRSVDAVSADYDFIVVGGGSAGPIVAGRLTESTTFSVLTALHLLADGGYQRGTGQDHGLSIGQSTVSVYLDQFVNAVNQRLKDKWIIFPGNEESRRTVARGFQDAYGLPYLLGTIDCTQVKIFPPPLPYSVQYLNRKGVHSLNVQLVLLLEAGDEAPIASQVPSFYTTFWHDFRYDWLYRTVPEGYCLDQDGKGCQWPRGKVLGGCSVLNGMMYHRGHAADYDDWVNAGAAGWSWEDNLPYFDLTEGNKQIGSLVSGSHHSDKGPMPVQQFRYQPPFTSELLSAISEAGLPVIADMNDPSTPDGFTVAQTFNENGQRVTTARAYLQPHTKRPNLSVKLNVRVTRVLLDGRQATGVEYVDKDGVIHTVRAKKEVILSAGALNSPHILLNSGIGPRETLEKFNIPVIADLPVGQNLRNHYGMTLYFVLTELNNTRGLDWNALTQYLLELKGPMTGTGITQLTGLAYSSIADRSRKQPDLQFFFNGFYAEKSIEGVIGEEVADSPRGRNISANAALLLPYAVGYLTLNSSDPLDPPLFYPGYFEDPRDLVMLRDGARYLQIIFDTTILKKKYGVELDSRYTAKCTAKTWSAKWVECMARINTDPQNHQMGTAAIGTVVDTQLRVKQVTGLRVIDASVMPTQVTGNPQGAVMMVAERGAAFIKNNWEKNQWRKKPIITPTHPIFLKKELFKPIVALFSETER